MEFSNDMQNWFSTLAGGAPKFSQITAGSGKGTYEYLSFSPQGRYARFGFKFERAAADGPIGITCDITGIGRGAA